MCHRATARPGRFAGISCSRSISPSKGCPDDRRYTHSQRWMMTPASKRIASHRVRVRETWRGHVPIQHDSKQQEEWGSYSVSGPASGSHSLHFIFFPRKTIRGLERFHWTVATSTFLWQATTVVRFELLE